MKTKVWLMGTAALSAGMLTACYDQNSVAPTPATPASQALDTQQVLALAQQTSETSTPTAVNNGAITITDTSETSSPISVNAM
jgi:uncharacterized lipoprotein YbaY